jgi:hypothetical protein
MIFKKFAVASAVTLASAGMGIGASSASAAPVITGGLVNVTVVDAADVVLRDVNVGVNAAIRIAANVCDTNVAVLVADFQDGQASCENTITGRGANLVQI